jgi:hypothetical protein
MQRDQLGVSAIREESQAITARHREDLIRNNGLSITSEDLDRRPIHENVQLHGAIAEASVRECLDPVKKLLDFLPLSGGISAPQSASKTYLILKSGKIGKKLRKMV